MTREGELDAALPGARILVISARALIRAGLAALLRGQPQLQLIGATKEPYEGLERECDVALWDAGDAPARRLACKFLALLRTPEHAQLWFDAGAAGCLLETDPPEELLNAIRQIARGETFLSPPILRQLIASRALAPDSQQASIAALTERERDILRLLAKGLSNKGIAQKLYLSVRTVEGHVAHIYEKLHLTSRTEAALLAVRQGWADT